MRGTIKPTDKSSMFIMYDGLIKNFQLTVLEILRSDVMKAKYGDILDIDVLLSLSKAQLEGLIVKSSYENVLKILAKDKDIDYDELLYNISVSFPDIYDESTLLPMGRSVQLLMKQSFMDKLYIYTPEYDLRIHNDLRNIYNNPQVIYTYGDFNEAIYAIKEKINCFAVTNVDYVNKIADLGKLNNSELIIANYGYNYKHDGEKSSIFRLDNLEELQQKFIFKYVLHNPFPNYAIPVL